MAKYRRLILLLQAFALASAALVTDVSAESFATDLDVRGNANIQEDGNLLEVNLDQSGGAEACSKQQYIYGRFDMQIKVVSGNSAGTVTSFFLYSPRPNNDEMDFELLGNVTGEPYLLHTNVWTNGQGDREQQINLWFDPREDFHNYTFIWNPHNIIWLVDDTPVRVFKNLQEQGIPYLTSKPLCTYAAHWNGDGWATRKGEVKIDWSQAPFTAYYRSYHADACVMTDQEGSKCSENKNQWWDWSFDENLSGKLGWVRENYLVYDYCQDPQKWPQGSTAPSECSFNM